MSEPDRILEAENSIQSIATELKRMRDAANILQGAETQVEEVLSSAQLVVETTSRFTSDCGEVIAKLAATDLGSKLDNLQSIHKELETATNILIKGIQAATKELDGNISKSAGSIEEVIKALESKTQSGLDQIINMTEKQADNTMKEIADIAEQLVEQTNQKKIVDQASKNRQVTIMVFSILTFLCAVGLLTLQFLPSLGLK